MTPTPEQETIIAEARSSTDSLLISALAGAAKTTTLELIVKALPVQPVLSLAFNKRIADEMGKRLPGHVKSATLNSVGHRVWASATGKRLSVNTKKSYEILKGIVDELPKNSKARSEIYEIGFGEILRAVGKAKLAGYIPEGKYPNARRLITREEFEESLEEDADLDLIDDILLASIKAAYAGAIDFDDQIYMPSLFGGTFPKFPLILVDEAQDLSPLNHAMLQKLFSRRIIGVGDKHQSIYAFRGADVNSMEHLRTTFDMRELTLSVSFRCPSEIVKLARKHAPHMQWWAEGGTVRSPAEWRADEIPDGAAIICRNNAPLFSCALSLLRKGRGVKLVGSDLGPNLIRTLKKLGPEQMTKQEVLHGIASWEAERLAKKKSKAAIADKAECLRVFANFGDTLGAAIAYAEHLFAAGGTVQLLSGHKSKGLEWDTVYHLDPSRIPSPYAESASDFEQEANLEYVITTRARKELVFVNLETLR